MSELVRVTTHGDVGVITITNPPVNALSSAVAESLASAVVRLGASDALKAIVVIGSGQTFIAGADIRELASIGADPSASLHLLPFLQTIEDSRKPVVMAIHGSGLGGGLETAMCGHYRVLATATQLGMPEVKLGLIPGGGGTQRLPRLVGPVRAAEMCLFGKSISAADARAFGLVDRMIEGDLLTGAIDFAREIAPLAFLKTREREARLRPEESRAFEELRLRAKRLGPPLRAPLAVLDAIEASTHLSFAEGCKCEAELFDDCLHSDESQALIHLFFAERAATKIPAASAGQTRREIARVAVVGAGTMGSGIAMAMANAGLSVLLKEQSAEALDRGMATIRAHYERTVSKGRLRPETAQERMDLIHPQLDFGGFGEVDLAIEAVFEDLAVKRDVVGELGKVTGPRCILATNTSSLDVDRIASAGGRPETTLGLHFFSPAHVMRLLEVIPGAGTKPEAAAVCMVLGKRLGKVAVLAGNQPGFIGNRVFRPYLREARFLVEEGASVEEVNEALTDFGMGMGPLAVDDLIGIDVSQHIEEQFGASDPPGLRKSALLRALHARGFYGQKTGVGWSKYGNDRRPLPNEDLTSLAEAAASGAGIARRQISRDEIVDRCLCGMINEGARVLADGVARRASDIDVVFVQGYGFPSWRGGPLFYADLQGLDNILARIRSFEARFGSGLWSAAPLLVGLAKSGGSFSALERSA